jgi:CRISPR-associated protein Cpf1
MTNFKLNDQLLDEYFILYKKEIKNDAEKEKFKTVQEKLRKEISKKFQEDPEYNGLFGKNMIEMYLPEFYKSDLNKVEEISEFKKFTTYFTGFNNNRKNMYVETEDSTAISYRIINENLPVFVSNLNLYSKIKNKLSDKLTIIEKELEEYIQVNSIDEIFSLSYFNETLTQKGIELYNIIISGKSKENGVKIKGINEYINEFNQNNRETKIPRLRQLYKQILSEKIGTSFVIDNIDSDNELVEYIQNYYINLKEYLSEENNELLSLIENIDKYDISKIFINNDLTITQISQEIFGDWNIINQLLINDYNSNYEGKKSIGSDDYEEERKKIFKKRKVYSLEYINQLIVNNYENVNIINYFKNYIKENCIIKNIKNYYFDCEEILNNNYAENSKELIKNEKAIEKIKTLLDEIKKFQSFIKLLIPKDKTIEKDENFYNLLEEKYIQLDEIILLYNKTRNYLTQKPFSTEKIKLNFETPTLLDGWDLNKEEANLGVILKKADNYYLGIINPYNRKIFSCIEDDNIEADFYSKMEYKLLPGPNKMLPKVFFSDSRISEFNPSKELLEKYKAGYHKKGKEFDLNFCHELIDFYKKSLNNHEDWKKFDFKFKNTDEYNDIGEFYNDVESQGYKVELKKYSNTYIDELVDKGDLYLFQIYNKDFSKYSKGKPNLHTMYWKALFDDENLNDIVYKLNGQAEIFYRKASLKLEDTAIHNKNEYIKNKNVNNPKKESIFEYDLIKNRRYTVDKFQFHVPISINFINEGRKNLNEDVNKYLKYNDVNVIGIDRGERNLLYLTVINPQGEILEQYSLNKIVNEYNNIKYEVDYHNLLDIKEGEREKSRESWKTVENIKELKEGYLSQVIHKIICLLDKYNAIIVIEDLNKGFKNSRIKVEKQVYQKFEKMLIDKLNYLIFKDKDKLEEGGLLNGYQLTNKFESFNKLGRQTGVLFYIPAWCTSKIDPTTGFVNLLNLKYESIDKSKELFNKFENINFNEKDNYFEFEMDYSKFTNRSYGIRKNWTICTYGNRIEIFRNPNINNNYDSKEINLTNEFKNLFERYNINYTNLKNDIVKQDSKEFWIEILKLLRLTLQMRNSIPNESRDYLISPVKNKKGYFYDSEKGDLKLPIDADANGAYNIARKGLMLIKQIRETDDSKLEKMKFNISNQDWLTYVQEEDK